MCWSRSRSSVRPAAAPAASCRVHATRSAAGRTCGTCASASRRPGSGSIRHYRTQHIVAGSSPILCRRRSISPVSTLTLWLVDRRLRPAHEAWCSWMYSLVTRESGWHGSAAVVGHKEFTARSSAGGCHPVPRMVFQASGRACARSRCCGSAGFAARGRT
jgi:hypothetical protein